MSQNPDEGTDLTIQEAIDNLPTDGGTIFVKQGNYQITTPIVLPIDKNVNFVGAAGAVIAPVGNIEVFQFPDGLSDYRYVNINDVQVSGDPTQTQTLFAYKDAGSYWRLETRNLRTTGIRIVDDVQAGDLTFTRVLRIQHFNANFTPTPNSNVNIIAKTPNPANTYAFPVSIHYTNSQVGMEEGNGFAWTCDFDGDLIFHQTCYFDTENDPKATGLCNPDGMLYMFASAGAEIFETFSAVWDGNNIFADVWLFGDITLTLSGFTYIITRLAIGGLVTDAHLVITDFAENTKASIFSFSPQNGVIVDILAGADGCEIGGFMYDATTAGVRTAAQRTLINGMFFLMTGAHKTIVDTGAGDFTLGVGNRGVNTGGGMTLAANSRVVVGTGINLA